MLGGCSRPPAFESGSSSHAGSGGIHGRARINLETTPSKVALLKRNTICGSQRHCIQPWYSAITRRKWYKNPQQQTAASHERQLEQEAKLAESGHRLA